MRTLVISDLHLGVRTGADVLARPEALDVLCSRLDGVDRLVLLGDTLELRHGPARDALARAEPVMRAIGDAMGADGEVVIVAGNHDHAIVAGWLDWRGRRDEPEPLGLEERVAPQYASWIVKRLAGWLSPASVEVAYPGLWLRDDVYATHGHYLDVHCVIPTLEVLAGRAHGADGRRGAAAGVARRLRGGARAAVRLDPRERAAVRAEPPLRRRWVGDRRVARARGHRRAAHRAAPGAARRLSRRGRRQPTAAASARVQPVLSGPALRSAGLAALAEVAGRLGLKPAHLVFGHTHRTGMLERDQPAEWRTPSGTRLHNAGCWVFETHFMGRLPRGESPYWPGGAIALDDDGPPRLERLLGDLRPRFSPGRRADQATTPGVNCTAWQTTPSPTSSSSVAGRVALVLDEREAARVRDLDRLAVDADRGSRRAGRRRALEHRPHAAGLVGARPRAGCSAVCAASSAPGTSSGRTGLQRLARHAEQLADLALRSRRRRPRRSASSAAAAAGRRGSAPATPRCRSRATARSPRR